MAKKQVIEEIKQGAPEYMNTYGDMMTLLLCFFVLLFSMSSVDAKKFEAIVISFSGSLGVLDGGNTLVKENVIDQGTITDRTSTDILEMSNFKELEEKIQEYLKENSLDDKVKVINEEQGLLLRFQDSILFDQGSALIKSESYIILKYISDILKTDNFKDKFISIEGHTDNIPIKNSNYSSNWELSVARACNVVRYMVENQNIEPKRLTAAGYSEYHPVVKNDSKENMSKNRRVDIMIMKSKDLKSKK